MRVILAVLRKELREVMRDPKTLLLTILIPLVFYPALLGTSMMMNSKQMAQQKKRVLNVGVYDQKGDFNLEDSDDIKVIDMSDPEMFGGAIAKKSCDIVLHITDSENSTFNVALYYQGSVSGELVKGRVTRILTEHKEKLTAQYLEKQGVSQLPNMMEINHHDVMSARESAGSKFGGAGAYFIVFLAFTGCMSVAVDAGAGEKERGTLESMMVTSASLMKISLGKLSFVVTMGIVSVLSTVAGLFGLLYYLRYSGAMAGGASGMMSIDYVMIWGIAFLVLLIVLMFAAVLYSTSIMAKTSREAHLRASMLLLVTALLLVYSTLPLVENSNLIMMTPVLNVAMAIRGLIAGTLSISQYFMAVSVTVVITLISVSFVSLILRKKPEKALLG